MILFSGKNVRLCIIRWLQGGTIPFRMPLESSWERRILLAAISREVPFRAYGFNNLGASYLPAPPVEQVSVNTDLGVAPLELLGKVFAFTLKPAPIGGRSISLSGSLCTEFLPEVLSLVWNLDGETPTRRFAHEPTPEYAIQLTATSMLPEFIRYCFVIETHMAIPNRVSIRGSYDRPIVSFEMEFVVPYFSWYTDELLKLPLYDDPPYYSENLLTIRDVGISSPGSILWSDLLGLIYGFSLTVTKNITPARTFPETSDLGVSYGVPTTPLVANEWGSVAQSVKEGLVDIRLELQSSIPSDANLPAFRQISNIYYYTREYFPLEINFANRAVLRATAQVANLSTSVNPDGAVMLRAALVLSEPVQVVVQT